MAEDALPSVVEFSEDISTAEAPPPIPAMEYVAQCVGAEVKLSNASQRKYAMTLWNIPQSQLPADFPSEEYADGVTLAYRRTSLEDDGPSRHRLRRFCEAIGAPTSKTIDVSEWVGLEATVVIDHEVYEGEERAVVKNVKAAM